MTTRLAWLALGLIVAVAIAVAVAQAEEPSASGRTRSLAQEIQCPECEGQSVANSQAPTARAIRIDLRRRVDAGQSDDEIRAAYAEKYGESILLDPEGEGLGALVWGLPIALVILGAGGLLLASRRWQREPMLHATDADEALVQRAREP